MAKKEQRNLRIKSVALNWTINYVDETDPEQVSHENYQESSQLDLDNDRELNKSLIAKPYLAELVPTIIDMFFKEMNSATPEATALKELVNTSSYKDR